MAKTKEAPWTEQKLMYKDGNVDVYRNFNWETWKRMTVDERAMWTEASMATPAPISKEVIDFNKKIADKADKIVKPPKAPTEEEQIAGARTRLKELGVKFAYNAKLPNLIEKLEKAEKDANNPE